MKKTLSIIAGLIISALVAAQIPGGYYDAATGLSGSELQEALHGIIKDHDSPTYGELWTHFESTDKKPNGKVWDIYSDVPGGNPPYEFTFYSDQCGNYGGEGDCYNREHTFPKSWFGGEVYPMYADLFQVYPTDGYVNGKRGNYPYGEVGSASWTSMNGSKLGTNTTTGYSGTVFEPIDDYKGDLARTYFYMATRYLGEDNGWPGSPMVDGAQPEEWALYMLFDWHMDDPVSEKETDRNNAIYQIQENRNPFIDHPEFAENIWFPTSTGPELIFSREDVSVFPNPVDEFVFLNFSGRSKDRRYIVTISDEKGKILKRMITEKTNHLRINTADLKPGFYFLNIQQQESGVSVSKKIIK